MSIKYHDLNVGVTLGGSGGGGKSPTEILYNPDFKLNSTGQTFWDGSNTGTSATSRFRIIDGWEIMRCTAEVVSDGIKIVPAASSAYLTAAIPQYWFVGKSLTLSAIVDDVEFVSTGVLQGSGNTALINTTFGRFYIYTYSNGNCALTLAFDNVIGSGFVISKASVHLTNV